MKKGTKRGIIWGSAAAIVVAAAVMLSTLDKKEVVFSTSTTRTGTVGITVMATGYIQPVEEVEVGTQVSGVIEKIYVDYNSHVTAGQLLAELDKSTLQEKLTQARASQTSAQADLVYARQNFNRVKHLHDNKAATDVSFEEAVKLLTQAETALANAKASTSQAEVNLKYAYIYSPINGVVLERAVNVGQTVAASFSTPTLFTIAEDLTKMQVEVDVDEADIGQVRVGQKATFTVDAYTDDVFEGTVSQVRLQPTVTSNVVTYTVIVEAPNPGEKLFPGMTASISIMVESETALTVPLEALNFKMTPEIAKYLHISDPGHASFPQGTTTGMPSNGNSWHAGTHMVWVKNGESAEQRAIETGINNGVNAIVKSGLSEGDEVILSATVGKKSNSSTQNAASFMPKPPRR